MTRSIQDDEIVFLVVPHVVRSQELCTDESSHHRHRRGIQSVELRHTSADGRAAACDSAASESS